VARAPWFWQKTQQFGFEAEAQKVKKIAIHFARFGPYHLARLASAVETLKPLGWRVVALEIAGSDATYDWEREIGAAGAWERETVFPDGVFEKIPISELRRGIERELDRLQPDAMAIAGWGTVDARACLAWCKKNRAQAIVMSETRAADGRRVWWKEWLKSRIVRRYDGALCGGESHRRYLIELGIPAERIAMGYNVVDNEFFGKIRNAEFGMGKVGELIAEGSKQVPCSATVPGAPYFLASNRFVERKNLGRLIQAYAKYAESFQQGGVGSIWPLVLLGDGELRGDLEALCGELGLKTTMGFSHGGTEHTEGKNLKLNSCKLKTSKEFGLVVFPGFRQIGELPGFYAEAGAFVHPALEEPWGLVINEAMASGLPVLSSRNVGAAEELVVEGKTGYLFDPSSVEEMADAMVKIVGMGPEARLAMGRAAFEHVERVAPLKVFGEGLAKLLTVERQKK
jgi:glycosyltransferase involved in cell wall biosynthesis